MQKSLPSLAMSAGENSNKILQLHGTTIGDCPLLNSGDVGGWEVIRTAVRMKLDNIIIETGSQGDFFYNGQVGGSSADFYLGWWH